MWTHQAATKTEDPSQSQTPVPPPPGRPTEERRTIAWVGKSVVFKGELASSEDMTIDGHVVGTISVRDYVLTIGPDADIRADIVAKVVVVFGRVTGHITASEKIHLHETASVEGDVTSPRFAMADGARLSGRVETAKHAAERNVPSLVSA